MSDIASTQVKNSISISIDNVLDKIENWRKSPNKTKGIPDHLWLKIFELAKKHPAKQLRTFFKLNAKQYKVKYEQLVTATLKKEKLKDVNLKQNITTAQAKVQTEFCEVKIAPNISDNVPPLTSEREVDETKKQIKTLRSNANEPESYLSLNTVIVECIHPNGQKLKIHTTNKSLTEVMQAFYHLKVVTL